MNNIDISDVKSAISCRLIEDKRLPEFVFLRRMKNYMIFDPSVMFDESFFLTISNFVEREKSELHIVNLDLMDWFTVDIGTSFRNFIDFSLGDRGNNNWIFNLDRYFIYCDNSKLLIYIERENDVGIISTDDDDIVELLFSNDDLRLKLINGVDKFTNSGISIYDHLTDEWANKINDNYR